MAETATQVMEREFGLARKLIDADRRARYLVDAAVAYAMQTRGEPTEYGFRQYAHDVALDACACLIRQLYDNDAEIKTLREERDAYMKAALEGSHLTPINRFFIAQGIEAGTNGTPKEVQPEGQEPGPERDAPK